MSGVAGAEQQQAALMHFLGRLYDLALDGGPALRNVEDLASDYVKQYASTEDAIAALIKWQASNTGIAGFAGGVGGGFTSAVTIPVSSVGVMGLQLRMAAAIALMRGYDPRSHQVRSFAYACLAGGKAVDVLKAAGVGITSKGLQSALRTLPGSILISINKHVGFRLLTKFGSRGAINLASLIPVVGGVISGGIDAYYTRRVGLAAKRLFPSALNN